MSRPRPHQSYILEKSDAGLQFYLPTKKHLESIILQGILSPFLLWSSGLFGYYFLMSLVQLAKSLVTLFHTNLDLFYSDIVGTLIIGLLFAFMSFKGYEFVRSLLWQLGGQEVVCANVSSLTLIHKTFHWQWSREYAISDITHFREDYCAWAVAEQIPGFRSNPERDGVITFTANGKRHRFAISVSRAEARDIVAEIKNYIKKGETA